MPAIREKGQILRVLLNWMEPFDTPSRERSIHYRYLHQMCRPLYLCYYNAFNPKNVKYWNESLQKTVWTKSLTDKNIFRMSLKLIMFSCTHAATLKEKIMKFWFSCKRTQNIILLTKNAIAVQWNACRLWLIIVSLIRLPY